MAVTIDSTNSVGGSTQSTTLTIPLTITTGNYVLVEVTHAFGGVDHVSSVVWNTSESLGRLGGIRVTGSISAGLSLWGLYNPTKKADNILITFDGTLQAVGGAVALNNVNTTTQTGTYASDTNTGATASIVVNDSAVGDIVFGGITGTQTLTISQGTEQWNTIETFASSLWQQGISAPGASGAVTLASTMTSDQWISQGITIKAAPVVSSTSRVRPVVYRPGLSR